MPSWKKLIHSGSNAHVSRLIINDETIRDNFSSSIAGRVATAAAGGISFNGSTSNGLVTYGGSTTADVESTLIYSGSRLGIGETSPDAKLHLKGGGFNTSLVIQGGGSDTGIQFKGSDGVVDGYIYALSKEIAFLDADGSFAIRHITDDKTEFRINNNIQATLTTTGLGIGNTSPSNKLDVTGTGRFTGTLTTAAINASGNISGSSTSTGSFGQVKTDAVLGTLGANNALGIQRGAYGSQGTAGAYFNLLATSGYAYAQFTGDSDYYLNDWNNLSSTGNFVGGYVNGTLKFVIDGKGGVSGSSTSTGSFGNLQTNNDFIVNAVGRVGINTLTPDYKLDVAGNVGINEYIYHNGDTNTYLRYQADQVDISAGGKVLNITSTKISGSATSTGSFGRVQASVIGGNSPVRIEADNIRIDESGNITPTDGADISGSATSTISAGDYRSLNNTIFVDGSAKTFGIGKAAYGGANTPGAWFSDLAGSGGYAQLAVNGSNAVLYLSQVGSGDVIVGKDNSTTTFTLGKDGSIVSSAGATIGGTVQGTTIRTSNGGGPQLVNSTPNGTTPSIYPSMGDTNTGIGYGGANGSTADNINLITGGTTGLYIDSSQNVVVPSGNISGSAASTGSFGHVFIDGNILGKSDNTTEIGGTPDNGAIKKISMVQGGEIAFGDTTTSNFFGISEGTNNSFGDSDTMGIYYRNGLNIYSANNVQRVKILASGNIGIGDTNPALKLVVKSTTSSDETIANFENAINSNGEHSIIRVGHSSKAAYMGLILNASDTAYFGIDDNPDDGYGIYVNENNQIGINQKAPAFGLDVTGTSRFTDRARFMGDVGGYTQEHYGDATAGTKIHLASNAGSALWNFGVDNSDNFHFYSYGTTSNVLSIARATGNVTMANNLTVNGTLTAQELIVSSSVTNMVIAEKSGSTVFGDDSADIHRFTGSLFVSGSQLKLSQENRPSGPTLSFGDGDTGFYESADDVIRVAIAGTHTYGIDGAAIQANASNRFAITTDTPTNSLPNFRPNKSDTDTGIGYSTTNTLALIAGGKSIQITPTGVSGSSLSTGSFGTLNVGGANFTSASLAGGGGGGVTISNNGNNRVLTGDGSNAAANTDLTWNGNVLGMNQYEISAASDFVLNNGGEDIKTVLNGYGGSSNGSLTMDEGKSYFQNTDVGIGTTSPGSYYNSPLATYQASVNYLTIATNTDGISSILMADGTTGDQAYRGQLEYKHTGDEWRFHAAATPVMTLKAGLVGIGTTAPANVLHLHEPDSTQNFLHLTNTTTGVTHDDGLLVGIDASENANIWNRENTATLFATNNTEKMRITSTGHVGIGTTTPSSQLNVVRSGTVSDNDTVILADISFTKTGGDADQSTLITGLKSSAIHNDANSGFGNLTGGEFNATNTQNKNAAGNGDNIMGISANTSHVAGIVNTVIGVNNYINVDAGGVDQFVAGSNITVDVESAVNITGNVYGQKIYMDVDDTNAAQVWGLEIEDGGSGNWDGGINASLSDGYAISGSAASTASFGNLFGFVTPDFANSRLGIGTDAPAVTFHAKGTSNQVARFENDNGHLRIVNVSVSDNFGSGNRSVLGDNSQDVLVTTGTGGGSPNNSFILLNHDGNVRIAAGGSPGANEGITVLDGGNVNFSGNVSGSATSTGSFGMVGVGVANPVSPLTVEGNISGSGNLTIIDKGTSVAATIRATDTTNGYGLAVEGGGTANTRYNVIFRNAAGSVVYGGISTKSSQAGFWAIGLSPTSTLASTLNINGNVAIGNGYTGTAAPTNGMIVQGNIGIGNTSPTQLLDVGGAGAHIRVAGSDNVGVIIESTNAARNNSLHFKNTADNKHFEFKQNSFDPGSGTNQLELLSTDTADIMVVNQNGNIGIGDTTPSEKLDVAGSINIASSAAYKIGTNTFLTYNGNTFMGDVSGAGGDVYIREDGTTIITISGGNTTVSGTQLNHISSTDAQTLVRSTSASHNASITIDSAGTRDAVFGLHSASTYKWLIYNKANDSHKFKIQAGDGSTPFILEQSGNATFSGNVTVGGNITAQQFITEYNTDIVVATSGSTKWGNTSDDTHQMTGSLNVNGAVNATGDVTLTSTNSLKIPSGASIASLPFAFKDDTNTGMWNPSNNAIGFVTDGTEQLNISDTGIATFSSDVNTTSINSSGPVSSGAGTNLGLYAKGGALSGDTNGGSVTIQAGAKYGGAGNHGDIRFRVGNGSNSYGNALVIEGNDTGAGFANATFSGNVTVTGTIIEASAMALKENINPIDDALDKILRLSGVTYDYKDSKENSVGFIAEQVNDVIPEVVSKDSDGNPQGVAYQRIVAVLVESVKQLTNRITKLENKDIYNKESGEI